jgi:hypothetical protein
LNLRQRLIVWFAVAAIIFVAYWLCLRYLFPGYYAPVSAFHGDFYEYASLRDKTLTQILRYPRPAAYFAMKVLGLGGLTWVMVNGIVVALVNIWLTVFLARQMSCCSWIALPLATALYSLVLFAHPDFYFEHRHDLPAEVSYFLAVVSLICWNKFLRRRGIRLLCAALAAAALFVFAKETYFVSFLCLVFGIALTDHKNWKWHAGYLFGLAMLEVVSFLWTAHLNGPFVNTHAAGENPYRIDLTPPVLANTAWFYLSRFLNVFSIAAVAWTLFLLRKDRRVMLLAIIFVAAGLAALAPHAILPNHLLEEYAWVGMPLLFAPLILVADQLWTPRWQGAVMVLLVVLTVFGYRSGYKSDELTFNVRQDQLGRHLARSVKKLHAVPEGSRALVAGLDATYIPFHTESFMLAEFGEHISWTVLTGPGIPARKNNRVTHVTNVPDARIDSYDQLVSYNSEGELLSIRKMSDVTAAEREKPYLLVPELRPLDELTLMYPREGYRKFLAANISLDWGLLNEAQHYLEGAAADGASTDATFRQLSARLAEEQKAKLAAPAVITSLRAQPERIVDTEGVGLGATELVWTISPPRQCEVHIGAPDGKLFAVASTSGSSKTEKWVRDGMKFYLQDVSGGRTLTPENTLAEVTLRVSTR